MPAPTITLTYAPITLYERASDRRAREEEVNKLVASKQCEIKKETQGMKPWVLFFIIWKEPCP